MKKAIGHRGLWFATVDGERLPCVHAYWFKGGRYHDPNIRLDEAKWRELVDAIRAKKKVILTNDKVSDEETAFQRTSYIAVFSVDDISVEDGLRFRFVDRLYSLQP
ncbi:MAG TPA: hypothetical protein VHG92_06090 [Afifellaceae bacterium]|nr:hypothetical protein [Afifellaceae bacterium]